MVALNTPNFFFFLFLLSFSVRRLTPGSRSRGGGRSANGTLTFRRSSTTPLGQSSQPPPLDNTVQTPTSETPVETPIAQPSTYDLGPARYGKDDLLDMFRHQKTHDDPTRLFLSGWNPGQVNGSNARGWGKSNDNHVPQEPGACWDQNGDTIPIGLQGLSAEEKEVCLHSCVREWRGWLTVRQAFMTDINSPLKPPTAQNKEAQPGVVNGRKASLSHGAGNTFGVSSPSSATRPGTRRRETLESNPFSAGGLASPTTARGGRDDPSYWFQRKNSELKESEPEEPEAEPATRADPPSKLPFGNLARSNTSGSAGMGSMWPPSNQATTPGAAGGGFGNFALPSPAAIGDKRGASSGGSRLAHLIPKETPAGEGQNPLNQQSWRSRPRTDTDPYGEDNAPSGSAALGGAQETSPTGPQPAGRIGTLGTPVKGSTSEFGMSGLHLGDRDDNDPLSPSETNPYRSPPAERQDHEDDQASERASGAMHDPIAPNFSAFPRGFGAPALEEGDRSQTSSVGAKAYPLGGMSGWPAPNPSTGTPDRERANYGNAFGNSLFNPLSNDLQSPGLGNLNNVFGPASSGLGAGSIGRGSKLGSLFPPAMQAQMQNNEQENNMSDSVPDLRQNNPLGAIGRNNFAAPSRDTESPMRSNRGVFEELFPSSEASRAHGMYSTADSGQTGSAMPQPPFTPIGGGLPFGNTPGGPEPPASQVRQMVMPDRMRWVYLDPQGQVQGPFTGLEMNDWYKANFFSPDLRVKKIEDPEFEPLGQLIRRIGNSREPFLVPQIGIPHGPVSATGPFTPSTNTGVVPPLSGVFPSFGRTLTAEEQNNLERRKQEEQFLVAQQREFMMRQQTMPKFPMQGGPGLQHHSSAQSLQSQPSFGSMTSPMGMSQQQQQQQQPIGAMAPGNFFDGSAQPGGRTGAGNGESFREDDLANLSSTERNILSSLQPGSGSLADVSNNASLRSGLPDTSNLGEDSEGFRDRLKEFEDLRAQHDAEQAAHAEEAQEQYEDDEFTSSAGKSERTGEAAASSSKASKSTKKKAMDDYEASLSLTQQVQAAQAVAAASEAGMPMPFPPPSSTTPLPAPTAQRVRSNLPEQYSRSQSGTPDTAAAPPPLAPWAKDPGESSKGPSLKEIQEAEARKAARAEEAAVALRKAAMEQEAALAREKEKAAAAASAAGLPASSTWGHGSPVSATSPWAKPAATKPAAPGLSNAAAVSAANKKTLADIQREEELRKNKAKDAVVQSGAPVMTSKSYANLAGKPGMSSGVSSPVSAAAVPAAAGWATVGAGGKVKVPTGPGGQTRTVSTPNVKPAVVATKPVSRPAAANGKVDAGATAMDEFNKWVSRELSRGITGVDSEYSRSQKQPRRSLTDVTVTSFQSTLDVLPLDTGIIADAVYSNSTTMDGRHFAEEFVRRKRLAEKGVVERQPSTEGKAASSAGGWSEVAKKSGSAVATPQEGPAAPGFKVVPSRKKGKK